MNWNQEKTTNLINRMAGMIFSLCCFFVLFATAKADSRNEIHVNWRELPVLPSRISANAREILRQGLLSGYDPHSFSKIGDCYASTSWFIADFDLGKQYYNLGPFESDFAPVIDYYQGSFGTHSLAARPGFTAASLLSPSWINNTTAISCDAYANPLDCELAAQNSLFAIFSIGTNDAFNPALFKENMREAIETAIRQHRLPILITKADDIEGGHLINQDIADLAEEYDLPIVNFWAAVQDLPHKGLQQDGVHLTFYKNDFNDPRAYDAGWTFRNISTLYMLQLLMTETISLEEEIAANPVEVLMADVPALGTMAAAPAGIESDSELAGPAEIIPIRQRLAKYAVSYDLLAGDGQNSQQVSESHASLFVTAQNLSGSLSDSILYEIGRLRREPRSMESAVSYYRDNPMAFIPEVRTQRAASVISVPDDLRNYPYTKLICPVESLEVPTR